MIDDRHDGDTGGGVRVIPTEDAIALMPEHGGFRTPTKREIQRMATRLQEEGMIEPIDLDDWDNSFGFEKLYAAVELGWETVIVTYRPRPVERKS